MTRRDSGLISGWARNPFAWLRSATQRLALGGTPGLDADFGKLWAGQFISALGSQVTLLALPLTAVGLGATPLQMGYLTAVQGAPIPLLGLIAGASVDRWPRRRVLLGANLGQALLLSCLPAAAVLGSLNIELLYVLSFPLGACSLLFGIACQAYIPALVGREFVREANIRLEMGYSVARLAGPGIGGVLVGAVSAPVAIVADIASFVAAAFFLVFIRAPAVRSTGSSHRPLLLDVIDGARVLVRHPVLRAIAGTSGSFYFFASAFFSVYLLYLAESLAFDSTRIGLATGIAGGAALAGALSSGRITRRLGLRGALASVVVVGGAGRLLVPLATGGSGALPLVLMSEAIRGFLGPTYNVAAASLRQSQTPDEFLGRVSATTRVLTWGLTPLGALLGGVLGELIGVRATLAITTVASTIASLIWLLPSGVGRTMSGTDLPGQSAA